MGPDTSGWRERCLGNAAAAGAEKRKRSGDGGGPGAHADTEGDATAAVPDAAALDKKAPVSFLQAARQRHAKRRRSGNGRLQQHSGGRGGGSTCRGASVVRFRFQEGYSQAVRRTVTMQDLLA